MEKKAMILVEPPWVVLRPLTDLEVLSLVSPAPLLRGYARFKMFNSLE